MAASSSSDDRGAGSVWNKNSWHWEEKNYTEFAKQRLGERLRDLQIDTPHGQLRIASIASINGEASLNIRKGKKILLFEFDVRGSWEGTTTDGQRVAGSLHMPDVSQDVTDFDVQVTRHEGSSDELYQAMRRAGREAIAAQLVAFCAELKQVEGADRLREDEQRRQEEARRMEEAQRERGAVKQQILEETKQREAERRAEEAKKAAAAPTPIPARHEAGQGSVWNVNSYHWEERPLTDWAKHRLAEMLSGVTVEVPGGVCRIKQVTGIDGEAAVNIRKGKKIVGYQLDAKCAWEGDLRDGDGRALVHAEGALHVPDIAEDVDDGEYEIRVTLHTAAPGADRLREAMRTVGAAHVRGVIRAFVEELKSR